MTQILDRSLTLRDIVFICVGAVIGSGIFIVPATVLQQTGNDPITSMVIWSSAGILSLLGALTYGELGAMNPEAGGLYVYIRDAFGSFLAFLYGWTLFFVIGSGAVATLSVAFSGYLGELVPLSAPMAKMAAIAMIAVVTAINVIGTRRSANVQIWTTAFKAAALLILAAALVSVGEPGRVLVDGTPAPDAPSLLTGAGIAMIGVLWAYEGWQFVTFSAGETVEAHRNFPLGLVIGTVILILLYCFANLGYIAALGVDEASRSESIAATAVGATFGPTAGKFVAAAILVSIFSAANAIVLTTPRVFYAMARDRVFFRRLADVHPDYGTPALAILSMSVWAALLAGTGTFEQLLTYVVFTGWIFYALGAASIFLYRRRSPNAQRPFRVPGYPVTPILFVLAAAAIVVNAVFTQTGRALIGIAGVLTGAPAFLIWRWRNSG